jgi:hypothetical protein
MPISPAVSGHDHSGFFCRPGMPDSQWFYIAALRQLFTSSPALRDHRNTPPLRWRLDLYQTTSLLFYYVHIPFALRTNSLSLYWLNKKLHDSNIDANRSHLG